MKISGTFLDEISHDIPHQNWGPREWEADFQAMKRMGIDHVVMIRCGWKRWMAYPSDVLKQAVGGYTPPLDLVELFLKLSEKYGMKFFFGLYDQNHRQDDLPPAQMIDLTCRVIDEAWRRYGGAAAWGGWYLTQEISRNRTSVLDLYAGVARHCKDVSGNLPTMISPCIQGIKAVDAFDSAIRRSDVITPEEHEQEWGEIFRRLQGSVDIVAFQDGHVDYDELEFYLKINKKLCDRFGMQCWTNCESFDRDMPIKFLPIKWEKMLLKLQAAQRAGIDKAITFEFSHFMSPNSAYRQAEGLYNRYMEHFGL